MDDLQAASLGSVEVPGLDTPLLVVDSSLEVKTETLTQQTVEVPT
jgi:hypothetical protein